MRQGKRTLREALASTAETGDIVVAPGIHDMIAALVANRLGFEFVYGTGYWMTASAFGMPDAGLVTYTEMRERIAVLVRVSDGAVIADADTGFGGLLNVRHTVRGYEDAGAAAIQLEDQEFPKKCGHTPFKRLIPVEDMAAKIKVAVEARKGGARSEDGIVVIARTDARQSEGIDGTLRRLEAYAKAGADVLFPEALESEEEMRTVCARFDLPVMANMANGGLTPIRSARELGEIGFRFAIFPSLTALTAASAVETALIRLRDEGIGDASDGSIFDFKTFCSMVGFEDVWEFERRWSGGS